MITFTFPHCPHSSVLNISLSIAVEMVVTDDPPAPKLDNPILHYINLAAFSHSELRALTTISNANFPASNSDDVVIPKINPALFNESAGGRKQTYSPRKCSSSGGRRRRFSSHFVPSKSASDEDESLRESRLIVGFFKECMQNEGENAEVPDTRKRTAENCDVGGVDLRKLELAGDLYDEELRRRTSGLEREEELLGFLKNLEGEWCSRRKKRRIVDANLLGDALPVGWKIIIALQKKAGRFSPYCRRYISPTGEHLLSCKEAAAYLSSYFASSNMNLTEEVSAESKGVVSKHAGTSPVEFHTTQDVSNTTELPSSQPFVHEHVVVSGVDYLCDVQVNDLFECSKCKVKFNEKDEYVKHLVSSHENTTKRCRSGSPIGKGVIFKDGKYECQFCHKVFPDKKRYSGHVGVHVRNYNRGSEELYDEEAIKCKESSVEKMRTEISEMDTLLVAAHNPVEPLSGSVSNNRPDADNLTVRKNLMEKTGKKAKSVTELTEVSNSTAGGIRRTSVANEKMGIDDPCVNKNSINHYNEETENAGTRPGSKNHCEDGNGLANTSEAPSFSSFEESPKAFDKGGESTHVTESGTNNTSTCTAPEKRVDSLEQVVTVFNKGSESFTDVGSGHGSASTVPEKLSFFQASPKGGIELEDFMLEDLESLNHNAKDEIRPINPLVSDIISGNQFSTMCVWCGISFYPEINVSETESDSVGYMCTTCRTKISKQITELERSWSTTSAFL